MAENKTTARSRTRTRIIGNTTFIITSKFSENSRETLEEKLVCFVAERISSEIKNTETLAIAAQK